MSNMTKEKNFNREITNLKWWENANKKTEEMARWIALYEAVNIIADKAEELGKDFSDIQINPLKVKDYMESTVDIYHKKLLTQVYGINVVYTEPSEEFNNF